MGAAFEGLNGEFRNRANYINQFSDTGGGSRPDPNVLAYLDQNPNNTFASYQAQNQPVANPMTAQASNPMASTGNPYLDAARQTTAGNMQQAQAATAANRINQSTPYANLQYQQTGTDAQGNPIWSANQTLAAPLQSALGNIQQNVANTTQNAFNASPYQAGQVGQGPQFNQIGNAANLQSQVQGTGMEGWDRATALINQRLAPQMAQAAESNTAALANQGIVPGTKAYENAMRTFNQGQNDLQTQAQLAGSQVQNTMFGQNLAAGQFGNQALTQQNQNQLANLGFNNATGQQGFANQLAGTQANNAAQAQNFTQNYNAYNNPLQQLGAFQQGTQPGYVNPYSQATVAGPDYLGAYSTQNAQAIAAQNAANARTANTQSGLYGLGSAALLGSGGLGGALSGAGNAIGGIGSGLAGISNWWSSLTNPNLGGGSAYGDSSAISNANSIFGDTGAGAITNPFGQTISNEFYYGV